ncbi:hypothetical protein [Nocardia aurantiaca]|uniref:Uncharacterized protein n=1 Tax=Nocardia aurantiaca TaxID=2675850 RepID=A0A6I3L669_9NOCA|nr:hypothetical protein [Nocardia aurantiaca]MTE16164.1 hypothetical protein [Nocardia aurantiaca]
MTNQNYRNITRQLFAEVASAAVAMATPVMAAVPAVAAPTPVSGIVQVDRPWGWGGHAVAPAPPPPPPVPPHGGCNGANCGDNGGTCGDGGCGDNGGTGGGPAVADVLGIHYTALHRHVARAGGTWNR